MAAAPRTLMARRMHQEMLERRLKVERGALLLIVALSKGERNVDIYSVILASRQGHQPTGQLELLDVHALRKRTGRGHADGTGGTSLGKIGGFLNAPEAIAINPTAGKMYVTNKNGNSVTMSNLDGSTPVGLTFSGLLNGPYGIALDVAGNRVHVATGFGPNSVASAKLDGIRAIAEDSSSAGVMTGSWSEMGAVVDTTGLHLDEKPTGISCRLLAFSQ